MKMHSTNIHFTYLLTYFTYFSHALKIITKFGIVAHAQEG